VHTVIVTVDDDPGVSRSVARDLRRHYGVDYRIVRAESGAQALDALRQMKLRGDVVAILLADYRMPEMNGIEFLEQAMDIYPGARRVLLTAYADTEAAIDAINVVDLDYYLLKPWDPPEEKLYPVLDEQLSAWRAVDHRTVPEAKVIGHRWSAQSSAVREFLGRNQVPYRWYQSEEEEGQRLLDAAGVDDLHLPVVISPGGDVLVEPDDAELARFVGLDTKPAKQFYDLVVVGAGPAGLGAAVYGASEGLRTVLVERTAAGGQAGQSSRIENYLGFPDGVSGAQLTDRARRQAVKFGAELVTAREVVGIEVNGSARTIRFSDGDTIDAHAVVLATGVSYRQLDAPGIPELTGRGVYYGSTMSEAASCVGQDVYIVGGANSAGQAAVYFSRRARSVHVLVRGSSIEASMSYYLVQQLAAIPNVTVHTATEVIAGGGDEHLETLTLRDNTTGEVRTVDAGWMFVFIGAAPRTDWLDGVVVRDERGFVVAGPDLSLEGSQPLGWPADRAPYHLETSVPGVFVAGDARAESAKRVASAVGEGAMAVMLVHRYLERR
jgi:thioredoxin reductase (NADPH)